MNQVQHRPSIRRRSRLDAAAKLQAQDETALEAGYNNRARVPEHPIHLARWAADSAALRARARAEVDLAYGPTAAERLDLFAPRVAAEGPARVLLFIHGGWFRSLDKADHSFVAAPFLERGVHVAVPNYALCPSVTVETIVMQMVRAVAWVWRRYAHGGRALRLVLAGHSAGGHLAAMLACCDWSRADAALPAHVVDAAVAISGVFELDTLRRTPFLQADLRLSPADAVRLSPAFMPAPTVPVHAWVGSDESTLFHLQAQLLHEAWGARAVPVCAELAGRHHFSALEALAEPGSALFEQTMQLLAP